MKKYGNYRFAQRNACFAIGVNENNIQQYVVWRLLDSNELTDAVFYETYEDAEQDFLNRSERMKQAFKEVV